MDTSGDIFKFFLCKKYAGKENVLFLKKQDPDPGSGSIILDLQDPDPDPAGNGQDPQPWFATFLPPNIPLFLGS